jgi:glycosyltransferase involved in cell wall biosynthesis
VVSSALPVKAAGYTVRTASITACQAAVGLDPYVAVRTGYEHAAGEPDGAARVVAGVPVTWLGPAIPGDNRIDHQQARSASQLARLAARVRPAVLHAHSDYHQPQLALAVGGELGIPVIYEVRGFWEETWASHHPSGEAVAVASERFSRTRAVESAAMCAADAVVTLSEVMRREIIGRGVEPDRVVVVSNAVDGKRFTPVPRDDRLAARLGIDRDDQVVGYISSFSGYEGIPYLLEAAARLRPRRPRLRVLLVGDGRSMSEIRETAVRLGLDDGTLVLPGRVPHDEILGYYSLLDVFVVPRTAHRVSGLVTPLKPYEAMALERPIIVSDLPALREVVTPGETGLVFRAEDADDLAARIGELLDDPGLRARLGSQARQWVLTERTWASNGARYRELYERLGVA